MEDRYFFDKRVMKKLLIKYGIMFLCLFPVLIVVNYFLNQVLDFWVTIIIDVTLILLVVFVVELILNKIKQKKENEEQIKDDRIIKRAEEIKKRKQNINAASLEKTSNQKQNVKTENSQSTKLESLEENNNQSESLKTETEPNNAITFNTESDNANANFSTNNKTNVGGSKQNKSKQKNKKKR